MSSHYPGYLSEHLPNPVRPIDLANQHYDTSPRAGVIPEENSNEGFSSSPLFTSLKSLYSLQEQLRGLQEDSSPLFKLLLKANYLLRNGVIFTQDDIDRVLMQKTIARNVRPRELKFVAYQEVSDYLAFINHSNKIYIIKADPPDAWQSFDVNGIIQALDFHPYKALWMAIATKDQVRVIYPETDEDTFLASLRPNEYRDNTPGLSKLQRNLILDLACTSLEFSPDGRYLAMINEHSNTIHLWDFDAKKLRSHFEIGLTFNKLKWSPDGAYLALSSDKAKKLLIMEVSTWQKQKWSLKAPIDQMSWTCDANTLYIFMREVLEIRAIKDVQLEKSKTAFEHREIEFRMADVYRLKLNDPRQLQTFAFCIEPNRLRYAYIASEEDREITTLGTIEEVNEEKVCEKAQDRPPVKAFFFMTKSGRPYEQKQPIIYKCYSKDEIENIKL